MIKKSLEIVIGFLHDFAAGCWAATVFTIFLLERMNYGYSQIQIADILQNIQKKFFYIGFICVVIVLITGIGRTFTYVNNIYGEDTEKTRRKMLVIKHIILFIIFGGGIYWQYIMAFK